MKHTISFAHGIPPEMLHYGQSVVSINHRLMMLSLQEVTTFTVKDSREVVFLTLLRRLLTGKSTDPVVIKRLQREIATAHKEFNSL